MTKYKEKVYAINLMEADMKVNGTMTKEKAKVYKFTSMEANTMASGKMINKMAWELISFRTQVKLRKENG